MGLDAAVAGSQKGLMLPPGLAFLALGERALARLRPRGYYLNLERELKSQRKGEGAYTPAINLVLAAREVLTALLPELSKHQEKKAALNARLYELGERFGLLPYPKDPAFYTPATAAFYLPEGKSYDEVKDAFLRRGYRIAGGQGPLKGKIFRLSLMGYFDAEGERRALSVISEVFAGLR